jgi:hypothetical protein
MVEVTGNNADTSNKRNRQPQDPGSQTEPGASSASLSFIAEYKSAILLDTLAGNDIHFSSPSHPLQRKRGA